MASLQVQYLVCVLDQGSFYSMPMDNSDGPQYFQALHTSHGKQGRLKNVATYQHGRVYKLSLLAQLFHVYESASPTLVIVCADGDA